jgi:hypothetical protein
MKNWGEKIFSSQQLGMKVYVEIAMLVLFSEIGHIKIFSCWHENIPT